MQTHYKLSQNDKEHFLLMTGDPAQNLNNEKLHSYILPVNNNYEDRRDPAQKKEKN